MADVAIRPSIRLLDDSFLKTANRESFHLSMELSIHELICVLIDQQKNEYAGLEVYPLADAVNFESTLSELKQIVENSAILGKWNSSSSLAINHPCATVIPNPVFNEKKNREYLDISFDLNADDFIFFDDLTNLKAKNVFTFPRKVHAFFKEQFREISFHHFSTSLIEPLFLRYKNRSAPLIVINVQKTDFQLIVFQDKSLRLYNSFSCHNEDDFVYFILFVFEQLRLDADKNEVILTGLIDEGTPQYKKLTTYIRHITFDTFQPAFRSIVPEKQTGRNYFSIFNQYMCVS